MQFENSVFIFGIRIRINYSIPILAAVFIMVALFGNPKPIFILSSYYVIIIFHEIGHLVFARISGGWSDEIILTPVMGLCVIESVSSNWGFLLAYLGGTIFQIFLFVISMIIQNKIDNPISVYYKMLDDLMYFTAMGVIINLMPVKPFDGFYIAKYIKKIFRGNSDGNIRRSAKV